LHNAIIHDNSIPVYDACYVTLAERLTLPVLTADNRFAIAMTGSPYQVLTLDGLLAPKN